MVSSTQEQVPQIYKFQRNGSINQAENVVENSKAVHSKHERIEKVRDDLDRKMRYLYGNLKTDVDVKHDGAVYTNVAFTILATTLLYLLFIKR
jgi:uncharacterized FlaG/YvyC family protein